MALLALSIGAESVPLLDPDEARFARVSVEMMRRGDLVVPHFEDRPRLVKPPLLHWLQSALFSGLGVSNVVARLHTILATLGTIALVGWIARRRFGMEGAAWAAACLATTPLVVAAGRLGTLDALLTLHVVAVVALDLAAPLGPGRSRNLVVGALLGLAFLTKGPVGVILPLLILMAGRTASRREILPSVSTLLQGTASFCVVVLPWGLALVRRVGSAEVEQIVRGEALERFFAGTTHVEPSWFYAALLPLAFFPWIAPLLLALVRLPARRHDPQARTALYAAAGFVVGLVFFTLSKGKLPTYILPLAPLAAIVVAWQIGDELRAPRAGVSGSKMLAGTLALFAVTFFVGTTRLDGVPRQVAWISAAIYTAGALVALLALWQRRPRLVYGTAAVTSAAFLIVVVSVLFPDLSRTRTSAYLIREVPALADRTRPLIMVEMKVPSLTFYLDRIPVEIGIDGLDARLDRDDDPVLVFDEVDIADVPETSMRRLRVIARQGKYVAYEKAR